MTQVNPGVELPPLVRTPVAASGDAHDHLDPSKKCCVVCCDIKDGVVTNSIHPNVSEATLALEKKFEVKAAISF